MAAMRHVRLLSLTSKLILRDSLKLNVTVTQNFSKRCLHAYGSSLVQPHSTSLHLLKRSRRTPLWSVCAVQRHNSTDTNSPELLTDQDSYIPTPPDLPSYVDVSELPLNALGEPSLQSLGLGSNWPPGLYQQSLEFLHVEGLPWVGAIALITIAVRLAMFPLNVMVVRNAAKTQNVAPRLSVINDKIMKANKTGNRLALMKHNEELRELMKKENVNPLKNFAVIFAQAPVFMTVFTGLRGMTNLPVESMKTGGLWWFTDITVPDPLFVLPMLTAGTLYMTLRLGAETGVGLNDVMNKRMKLLTQVLPLITLVLIAKFPSALCFYWLTSNVFSLVMKLFFNIKPVRKYFDIPDAVSTPSVVEQPGEKPSKKRGFVETFQEGVRISEKVLEYESRKQVGAMTFKDDQTKTPTSTKKSTVKQEKGS
ncbi:mitochondrial inner membrane protein OXA1L-like [Argopecten irradians]|uniref:mitochondrial inner membrane protein OXA1L-like n=1 Tax=Argopecten irradians TaxID=31199 RepID=UPI003713A203